MSYEKRCTIVGLTRKETSDDGSRIWFTKRDLSIRKETYVHEKRLQMIGLASDFWACAVMRGSVCVGGVWLVRTRTWHDTSICVTWLIYMWHDSFIVWYESFICLTWLIHMCDVTHSYVWHDSFVCVTWLIPTCDMTHPYVWHDSFICVTWLIYMCDMTHLYVWHDSFIAKWADWANWANWTNWAKVFGKLSSELTFKLQKMTMGWLRLVGSLKWWVSFAEYSLFYRALLQKRPIIGRSSLIVANP